MTGPTWPNGVGGLSRRPRLFSAAALLIVLASAASGQTSDENEQRFAEGLAAYDAGDYETTVEAWFPLAEAGVPEAQVALADLYMNGLGVKADPAAAAAWYRRAAEAGDAVGQLNLGDLYARGLGVPPDLVEAYAWFSLSAVQGRVWPAERRDEIAPQLDAAQKADAAARITRYKAGG